MVLAELFPYAHIVYDILMVLYVITIVSVIIIVIGENRNPLKSLAWVAVLVLLPVAGLVLYLFFGRSLRSRHLIPRKDWMKLVHAHSGSREHIESLVPDICSQHQMRLAEALVEAPCYTGNNIDIYTDGKSKFEALKHDIETAQDYILLQYYIFENDAIGHEISNLLIKKAQQGIHVHVIYDHIGSYTINAAFFHRMRRAGVEAYPFLKVTFTTIAARLNWRNHRKMVVIDGKVGYIGGMNIADRYVTGEKGKQPWRDTHIRITGEAVKGLFFSFAVDWDFMQHKLLTMPQQETNTPATGNNTMQIVASGPTDKWNAMAFVVQKAISMARKSLYIQTPYFLPNDAQLKALQVAALSGVDVRLMIPRDTDSVILKYATRSYLKECLLAGIKIYFYESAMMHSKAIIVDDNFVTVGSTNFDFRSFEHNFECNALIYNQDFNRRMKEIFAADQRCCTRIILSEWKRRNQFAKAFESILRLLAPIL